MKNYQELFEEKNKDLFKEHNNAVLRLKQKNKRKKQLSSTLLILFWIFSSFSIFYTLLNWEFLGFTTHLYPFDYDPNYTDIVFICCISTGISVLIGVLVLSIYSEQGKKEKNSNEIDNINEKLEEKAKEFAIETYMEDVFTVLTSRFTLSQEFKEKMKINFEKETWFDTDDDELSMGGFSFDHLEDGEDDLLVIEYEGYKHYLKGWDYYEDQPFRFFLERIHLDGRVEKLEYELSAPE